MLAMVTAFTSCLRSELSPLLSPALGPKEGRSLRRVVPLNTSQNEKKIFSLRMCTSSVSLFKDECSLYIVYSNLDFLVSFLVYYIPNYNRILQNHHSLNPLLLGFIHSSTRCVNAAQNANGLHSCLYVKRFLFLNGCGCTVLP